MGHLGGTQDHWHHFIERDQRTYRRTSRNGVEVKINRRVFDYDQVIIIAPVFPLEVVGFSD